MTGEDAEGDGPGLLEGLGQTDDPKAVDAVHLLFGGPAWRDGGRRFQGASWGRCPESGAGPSGDFPGLENEAVPAWLGP